MVFLAAAVTCTLVLHAVGIRVPAGCAHRDPYFYEAFSLLLYVGITRPPIAFVESLALVAGVRLRAPRWLMLLLGLSLPVAFEVCVAADDARRAASVSDPPGPFLAWLFALAALPAGIALAAGGAASAWALWLRGAGSADGKTWPLFPARLAVRLVQVAGLAACATGIFGLVHSQVVPPPDLLRSLRAEPVFDPRSASAVAVAGGLIALGAARSRAIRRRRHGEAARPET